MCAHSVSDTSPPQTDCLALPVMGTPLENLFPPSTHRNPRLHTHTHTHTHTHSSPQTILLVYLSFCGDIFPKLPTFRCLSIRPFLCIIFNQSSPLSKTADFLQSSLLWFTAQRKGRKERLRNRKREIRKERESVSERISIFPLPLGSSE